VSGSENGVWTSILDVVEALFDLMGNLPGRSPAGKPPSVATGGRSADTQVRPVSEMYYLDVPSGLVALRRRLNRFVDQNFILLVVTTWMALSGISYIYSELVSFLVLHSAVLAGVVIFDYDSPVQYRGYCGVLFRAVCWLFLSMAIVVPLFIPVEITGDLIRWMARLAVHIWK
jgi:hypothetical protein